PGFSAMTELTAVGIDYTKVAPLQQKRVHAFITQYVSETVSYLNRLSTACEQQLEDSSVELRRLDATLSILESKLASLPPDLQQQQPQEAAQQPAASATPTASATAADAAAEPAVAASGSTAAEAAAEAAPEAPQPPKTRVADHPLYAGFFKMLKVGVPIPAIKAKMQASGVDPAALDLDPSAPAPDTGAGDGAAKPPAPAPAPAESDSNSDFTDSD
ncbi:hypothetical protein BOX15_Mlig002055g3, partial [Macrostomum lignano]